MKNQTQNVLLTLAAMIVAAMPAFGAGLTVTNAAAMGAGTAQSDCAVALATDGTDLTAADNEPGPCGLEVNSDGTSTKAFVTDTTPSDESIYRATFFWDYNDLETAGTSFPFGGAMTLFRARNDSFGGAFQVMTRLTRNRGFRVWIRAVANNGNNRITKRIDLGCDLGGPCIIARVQQPVQIQAEWTQGATCGITSGSAVITVFDGNGTLVDSSPLINQSFEEVGINNCQREVDLADMGMVAIFAASNPDNNSMYFDEFQSFRTLAP